MVRCSVWPFLQLRRWGWAAGGLALRNMSAVRQCTYVFRRDVPLCLLERRVFVFADDVACRIVFERICRIWGKERGLRLLCIAFAAAAGGTLAARLLQGTVLDVQMDAWLVDVGSTPWPGTVETN